MEPTSIRSLASQQVVADRYRFQKHKLTNSNNLNTEAVRFGMHRWGSDLNLLPAGEPIEVVESYVYLGHRITAGCLAEDENSLKIANARVAISKLRHLRLPHYFSLSMTGRVDNDAVRSIMHYGSENWIVQAEDVRKLCV